MIDRKEYNPSPDINVLRDWDINILLNIYSPEYLKPLLNCHLCALGPCGFTREPFGKCGIDKEGLRAREVLLDATIGASGHTSFARRLLDDLILRYGKDCPIDMGDSVRITTPLISLIYGKGPKTLGEMEVVLSYIEKNITHLLSSINYGTEASGNDFISKALHVGMLDSLALEVADISQISALNMPKGISNSPIVPVGLDRDKLVLEIINRGERPFILIIGHNSVIGTDIIHLLEERGLDIYVGALCCSASDLSRHCQSAKIIGNQADQLDFIRSGIADVIILDTQCIRPDVINLAREAGIPVIATSPETSLGLKDLTDYPVDDAVETLSSKGSCLIFNKKKAAEVSINSALESKRLKAVSNRLISDFRLQTSDSHYSSIRIGRGPVRDSEIRGVAPSIVMGEIPGIVGFFGCPEEEQSDIYKMAEELLKRGYIVATGGCSSIDLAKSGDIFKKYRDTFDSGNLINLGSCVSASHLLGACIKIASVVSHRPIEGNYMEIADYILNRVGATLVLWGAFTHKAFASTLGTVRLGIPVIFGPRGKGYSLYLSGKGESSVIDARLGDSMKTVPHPSHLIVHAKSREDALILISRLCIRHSDTTKGREIKLRNYIEFYRYAKGEIPPDLPDLIRTEYDMPEEVKSVLHVRRRGWIPDPTMLKDKIRERIHGGY